MQKEKSIYADVLESAISWRVRDKLLKAPSLD